MKTHEETTEGSLGYGTGPVFLVRMSTAMGEISPGSIVVGLKQFRHTKEAACPELSPISRYLIN